MPKYALVLWLFNTVIGSNFSRNFFNQSEFKPKPIVARACTFFRALCQLRVLIGLLECLRPFWLTKVNLILIGLLDCLRPFWLAKVITLVLALRHPIETRSIPWRSLLVTDHVTRGGLARGHETMEGYHEVRGQFSITSTANARKKFALLPKTKKLDFSS